MQDSVFNPAVLLAAFLLSVSPSGFADLSGSRSNLDWLKSMAFAAHQTDYTGTFVYQYGNQVETSRITHISDRDGEYGRLEGLDGVRREIIHNNDQVWSYVGDRQVSVEKHQRRRSFPALLPEQLSLLSENYQIRRVEQDRVAGFPANAFLFLPRDNLRYTHKLWAHTDSGLLLKAAVLDFRGRVVEQYAFTQLTIGGNIDRKWITPNKSVSYHSHHPYAASPPSPPETEKHTVHESGWQVDLLPPGFKKTLEISRPLRGKQTPVTHLIFSDGLAGISVFIEDIISKPDVRIGLSSKGVLQVYSKVSGHNLITVVGEVPPRTVMQVADSARYRGR